MSDGAIILVATDVSRTGAKALAKTAVDHLVANEIVARETSDCSLSEAGGHRPGVRWRDACQRRGRAHFTELRTNGVEARAGREVFHALGLNVVCAACKHAVEDVDDAWNEAVGAWHEGDDDASYACPHCGVARTLNAWDGPFRWAFGNFGLVFWNWPPLRAQFIRELESVLGHRLTRVFRRV